MAELRNTPGTAPPAPASLSDDPERLLNFSEACRFLGIGERLGWQLCNVGELPGFKIGSRWKFRRAALIAWAEAREQEGAR